MTAKHGLLGLCRVIAKEGAEHGVRCNVICPGFVRTPLVDKQIREQANTLEISDEDVVKKVMLGETVDDEFTTVTDVAQVALLFASFESSALTGRRSAMVIYSSVNRLFRNGPSGSPYGEQLAGPTPYLKMRSAVDQISG